MSFAMKYAMKKRMAKGGIAECMACKGGMCMEHGGQVEEPAAGSGFSDDMVDRIMKHQYSKGGMVANDTPPVADFEENEFDDLVLRDDLDFHETGSNSGDLIGNDQEDEDREDILNRIMKSRAKKDRMPRPA